MKKSLFILSLCYIAMLPLQAKIIDELQSRELAVGFVCTLDGVSSRFVTIDGTTTITSTTDASRPILYIHNIHEGIIGKSRFIIVSGDTSSRHILAYGDEALDMENIPGGLQDLIDLYQEQIEALIKSNSGEVVMLTSGRDNGTDGTLTVEPLLKTMWGQGAPYNNRCPVYHGDTCSTGCGSTALAMIFKYHEFANSCIPVPEYSTKTLDIHLDALEAIEFDWYNMLDTYEEGSYTDEQADAVAWLMRYIGQCEKMDYTPGSSASFPANIEKAFKTFGYSCTRADKDTCDDWTWAAMIQAELQAEVPRPVLYISGKTENTSHAYVIDGYDADGDRYHINWGWNGNGNAHCALNAFKPNSGTSLYSHHQQMYINLQPAEPAITVDQDSLTFEEFTGYTQTKTITVTSTNLTKDIRLQIHDYSGPGGFTVTPAFITPADAVQGKEITVTFTPGDNGYPSAWLTLSSDEMEPVDVMLSGHAIRSDGYIIPDTTEYWVTDTISYDNGPEGVRNFPNKHFIIGFTWIKLSGDGNPIMMTGPSTADITASTDPDRTRIFNYEMVGDTASFAISLELSTMHVVDPYHPSAVDTTDFGTKVRYSFHTLGTHDITMAITHKTLSTKPVVITIHGTAVLPDDAPFLPGDVNGNGIVDIDDVIALIAHILNNSTAINTQAADLNGDGSVDVADITLLIKYVLGG